MTRNKIKQKPPLRVEQLSLREGFLVFMRNDFCFSLLERHYENF